MSPEERAKAVELELDGLVIVSKHNRALIAQAIRQAENEAIERCARAAYKTAPDYASSRGIRDAIRSLATKDP